MACRQPKGPARALQAVGAAGTTLACLAATIAIFGAPAAASPGKPPQSAVGHDRARIAALYRQELAEARSVHSFTLAFAADVTREHRLEASSRATSAHLAALRMSYAQTVTLARADAILSYVGEIPTPPPSGPGADFATKEAADAYETATLDNITLTMARLGRQQLDLAVTVSTFHAQLSEVKENEAAAIASKRRALGQAARLEDLMSDAQHQLARAQLQAQAAAGPPVGNGLVKAVSAQLDHAAQGSLISFTSGPKAHAAATFATSTATRTGPTTTTTVTVTTATAATTTSTTSVATSSSTTAPTTATSPTGSLVPTTVATTTTAPTTTTEPATTSTPSTTGAGASGTSGGPGNHPPPLGGVWLQLRECESSDNYAANSGNGFYGAYQFSAATWSGLGYPGRPDTEPYWLQDQAAERLHASQGWSPWPACSAALGL